MTDTAFFNDMAALAVEMINDFGFAGSFVKKGQAGGVDDYGQTIPASPDITVTGRVTPKLSFKQHEIDGTNILASDGYVFFDSDSGKPDVGYEITLNGLVWRVISDMSFVNPDSQVMFLKYQIRA